MGSEFGPLPLVGLKQLYYLFLAENFPCLRSCLPFQQLLLPAEPLLWFPGLFCLSKLPQTILPLTLLGETPDILSTFTERLLLLPLFFILFKFSSPFRLASASLRSKSSSRRFNSSSFRLISSSFLNNSLAILSFSASFLRASLRLATSFSSAPPPSCFTSSSFHHSPATIFRSHSSSAAAFGDDGEDCEISCRSEDARLGIGLLK